MIAEVNKNLILLALDAKEKVRQDLGPMNRLGSE